MLNHLNLQGRLVADPDFGTTNSGTNFANFRLAWSEKYRDKESKLFIECKAFGGTSDFMKNYMNKQGQEIVVEGKLNTEEWERDGQKRSKIVLIVSAVHFCGKCQENAGNAPAQAAAPQGYTAVDNGELPF